MVIGKKNLSGNIKPSDQFAPVCKVSAVAIVEGPHPLIVLMKLFLIGDGPMDPVFFKMILDPIELLQFFQTLLTDAVLIAAHSKMPDKVFRS